ncbi:DUF1841 family protein [Thiorhodococcus mannitoliphagus]|uniref:DUF1841 family protein n=1 Tax=Thiorhodococcus mannitoliphagus TaxID=329406 RepID=A0A6P1DX34_9GAMM|nr:DUF1841 family protein [Thiorhodococcus mannitoliphagus]NEX22748.1 DUF1841 family protein [Thiorhodococcus mannitoliphagus]
MLATNRETHRRIFIEAWRKATDGQPLEPVEAQIVSVIRQHPEYQSMLETGEQILDKDFITEAGHANPFFHMGLHIAVHEQLSIDRPQGIRAAFQDLCSRCPDTHAVEHRMMECLAQALWTSQQGPQDFDEVAYLECIRMRA